MLIQQYLIDYYKWRDLRYFLILESKSPNNIEEAVRSLECTEFDENEEKREDWIGHIWRPPSFVADSETRFAVSVIDASVKNKIIPDPRAKTNKVPSTASYINVNCMISPPPPTYIAPTPLSLPDPPCPRPLKKIEKKVRNEVNDPPPWMKTENPPTRGRPANKDRLPSLDVIPPTIHQLPNLNADMPNLHYQPPKLLPPIPEPRHYNHVSWQQKPQEWSYPPPPPPPPPLPVEMPPRPIHTPTSRRGAKRGRPCDPSKRGRKPSTNTGSSMANLELVRVLQFLQKTYNH